MYTVEVKGEDVIVHFVGTFRKGGKTVGTDEKTGKVIKEYDINQELAADILYRGMAWVFDAEHYTEDCTMTALQGVFASSGNCIALGTRPLWNANPESVVGRDSSNPIRLLYDPLKHGQLGAKTRTPKDPVAKAESLGARMTKEQRQEAIAKLMAMDA